MQNTLDEIAAFAGVLDAAIPERNREIIALTIDQVGDEGRELGEKFPGRTDTSIPGGLPGRLRARGAVRGLVLSLRQVAMAGAADDFDAAAQAFTEYRQQVAAATDDLKRAARWSLFDPQVRAAHFAAMKQLADRAK